MSLLAFECHVRPCWRALTVTYLARLAIQTRARVLIPGFTRAMKDPFGPSRIAGIMSLAATQEFYEIDDIAKKILPNLCVATVDPDKYVSTSLCCSRPRAHLSPLTSLARSPVGIGRTVRQNAFTALKHFLRKVEYASENEGQKPPESLEDENQGMLGWAFSSITKKVCASLECVHLIVMYQGH